MNELTSGGGGARCYLRRGRGTERIQVLYKPSHPICYNDARAMCKRLHFRRKSNLFIKYFFEETVKVTLFFLEYNIYFQR